MLSRKVRFRNILYVALLLSAIAFIFSDRRRLQTLSHRVLRPLWKWFWGFIAVIEDAIFRYFVYAVCALQVGTTRVV